MRNGYIALVEIERRNELRLHQTRSFGVVLPVVWNSEALVYDLGYEQLIKYLFVWF
jgi:hypothetical protein